MRECGTGGGAVIKGEKDRRSPHPSPSCKPAGGRRGGEYPGRRSLEGVGGVLGLWVIFGIFGMCSSIPGRQGVARWPRPTLGQGVAQ